MVYKRLVHKTVTAWGRIDTAEVPVTKVVRTSIVQAAKALEYQLKLGVEIYRFQQVSDFI